MDALTVSQNLVDFIGRCPSMFHATHEIAKELQAHGFEYLPEGVEWNLQAGANYFTTRNGSSVTAFKVGANYASNYHFQIAAAHTDAPSYRVKAVPELEGPGEYLRLNVEGYGGVINSTWLDRPLSVAGRVMVKTETGVESRLLYIDHDILLIPNVAIHMNREINSGFTYNQQVDLCPLFSAGTLKKGAFVEMLAEELSVEAADVAGYDLFLVNRTPGSVWGAANEFVSAPKLDDLQCVYAALQAFLTAENAASISVLVCFDNEEVGSNTKQGALSTFMADTLLRVNEALGHSPARLRQATARSFLVSCDNAHAAHPNHPEKTDDANRVWLNCGVVVKEAANQKYTTDAFSRAVFEGICTAVEVPVQRFANRSDAQGGSTLGNLSNMQVSMHAVDMGLPQLAMHSAYETAGAQDTAYGIKALDAFYNAQLEIDESAKASF